MEERIIELEVKVAYQDRVIADLDEVIAAFTKRVEDLERQLRDLREALTTDDPDVGPADDPPPHY
jgi:SlyX protein